MPKGIGLTGPKAVTLNGRDFAVACNSELFSGLSPALLDLILPRTRLIALDPGETLIERGALNDFVYLILEGSLSVHLGDGNADSCLHLGPGTCAGEISVIDGGVATARVVASEFTRVVSIDGRTLWYLIANTDVAARNLLLIFSGCMRHDNDLLVEARAGRQALATQAGIDPVTGLHSQSWMEAMFSRQLMRCARDGLAACLIIAAIDDFADLAARRGHEASRHALRQTAAVLARCVRPTDLLARHGPDGFAILLPVAELNQAQAMADRACRAVGQEQAGPGIAGAEAAPIALSCGVARMQDGDTLDRLYAAAGAALRQARQPGRA